MNEQEGFESLEEAERLLAEVEGRPEAAALAAKAALRALLLEWGETPGADTVTGLVEQAAKTDDTLMEFHPEAEVLDRFNPEADAAERAKIFVDAARARLVNI